MSTAPRTRQLCPRCLESFETTGGTGESLCPDCHAREHARESGGAPVAEQTSPQEDGTPADEGSAASSSAPPPSSQPPREASARRVSRLPAPPPTVAERYAALPPPATTSEAVLRLARREAALAAEWCEGRMPWFRALLWLYLGSTFVRHLGSSEPYRSLFDGINLGIHEMGHAIFRPLGEWWHVAGGTLTQLAAPLASLFIFRKQHDYFGITVGLCWLATNLWGISVYLGDARALELPLVAPGMGMMPGGDSSGGIIHDWNYLLGAPGLLKYDTLFAGLLATAAVVVMGLGLAMGAWMLVRMVRSDAPMKMDFE